MIDALRVETGRMVRLRTGEIGRILSIDEEGIRIELSECTRTVQRADIAATFSPAESTGRGYSPRQVSVAEDSDVLGEQDGGGR
jgi:hypothetical protein